MLNMSGISAALMVFRLLYDRLVRELDERAIPPPELRAGMILAPGEVDRHALDEFVAKTDIGFLLPDGLTVPQARELSAELSRRGVDAVKVSRTAPFAVFLLMGFVLTCVLGGAIKLGALG
jgi:hypothetical protein